MCSRRRKPFCSILSFGMKKHYVLCEFFSSLSFLKSTFQKTREITRAYAGYWRIPSSPIVGEICVQYVLVGSGYVMVGSGKRKREKAGGAAQKKI